MRPGGIIVFSAEKANSFPGRAAFPCIRVTLDLNAPVGRARSRPREVGGKNLAVRTEQLRVVVGCGSALGPRPFAPTVTIVNDVLIAVVRSPWPVAARRKHHGAAA